MESSNGSYSTSFVENYFSGFYSIVDKDNVFVPQGGLSLYNDHSDTNALENIEELNIDFETYNEIVNNGDAVLGEYDPTFENWEIYMFETAVYHAIGKYPEKLHTINGKPITYSV